MEDELGRKIITKFTPLRPKHITIQQMIKLKTKKQRVQKSAS